MHGISELLELTNVLFYSLTNVRGSFLTNLKQKCHGEPGNTQFWPHVQKQGRGMSLISDTEAAKHGGKSTVSERKAEKVRSLQSVDDDTYWLY